MRIAPDALHNRIVSLLTAHGASHAQADATARHMVWCEGAGRHNFGIERMPILVKRLRTGVLNGNAGIGVEPIAPSLVRIDGGGGFGYAAAERAMQEAIALARRSGVAAAGVRNSNFFGAGAYYVNLAADAGMIGLALSNSFPKVVAHGGLKPVLGTNPFAFGAPRRTGEHLLFDMATSALAGSTVREHMEKGTALPEGLAIDAEGRPITDPAQVSAGALLPFGGAKGFGLSLLVEILAGVITGAGIGDGVASMYSDFSRNGDNGHFLLAVDVARFMPMDEYHARFETLVAMLKTSGDGILLPGEHRWAARRDSAVHGIIVDEAVWRKLGDLLPV
ncbi:MAG: Ldh family oxidoreductase [Alphaproteobacteria bacterium]|nr:Ldh family oxidoreductase [Alphaproteobacteria bacterium]